MIRATFDRFRQYDRNDQYLEYIVSNIMFLMLDDITWDIIHDDQHISLNSYLELCHNNLKNNQLGYYLNTFEAETHEYYHSFDQDDPDDVPHAEYIEMILSYFYEFHIAISEVVLKSYLFLLDNFVFHYFNIIRHYVSMGYKFNNVSIVPLDYTDDSVEVEIYEQSHYH